MGKIINLISPTEGVPVYIVMIQCHIYDWIHTGLFLAP